MPGSGIICGILQVWHDERASYKAVLGPRPYKRRPEQVIRIGQRFWQLLIPAFSDLFGEQIPDHIHLHLAIRDSEAQRTIRFIQPDGRNDRSVSESSDRPLEMPRNRFCNPSNNPTENLLFPRRTLSPYQPISGMSMSQQNEKSKQMENQNKPNRQSTSRHHGTHPHGSTGPIPVISTLGPRRKKDEPI